MGKIGQARPPEVQTGPSVGAQGEGKADDGASPSHDAKGTGLNAPAGALAGTGQRNVALDGVRGVGILFVMAYHSQLGWASGGLMMIETFFVLSGFLITGLLVKEWGRSGTIRLGRFWARRARRLLPALLLLLVGIGLFAWLVAAPDQRGSIRTSALFTLFYAGNWHQIASGQSYFALTAQPSPLLHTWTLAIEEQFYLVWPILVLAVLHFTRRLRPLLVIALVLAVASAVWMAILYQPGVDPSRLYYGTDTRAQGVLIGAALAVALAMRPQKFSDWGRRLVAVLAVLAVAGITAMWFVFLSNPGLIYQGGFLICDVLFAMLFLGLVQAPQTGVAKVLSWRPLVYIGTISYSLYLWHWPVDLWLNTARTGLTGWPLFGVRSLVAGVIAAASTRWIENPIRLGTFRPWKNWTWTMTPAAVLATAGFVMLTTITPAPATVPLPPIGHAQTTTTSQSTTTTTTAQVSLTAAETSLTPESFLLLGDSQARTIGIGLQADAKHWNVKFDNQGKDLCDWGEGYPPNTLDRFRVIPNVSDGVTNLTGGCINWQKTWSRLVDEQHPEVIGLLMGRLSTFDHYYQGHWVHIGEPVWDNYLISAMNLAINILTSHGAAVILMTTPYVSPTAMSQGIKYVGDTPGRVDLYNRLVRKVAAQHPGKVTVYDLNKEFAVNKDVYSPNIDGYVVRNSDGIHFTKDAGELAGIHLFPIVRSLAQARAT